MQHNSWKRDRELLSEAYSQLSSSDRDDMDPSVTGQGGDFPPLEKGQLVWVDYNDGSRLTGVLDFDGVDLARSNMFTLDGGEALGVENIVNIGKETGGNENEEGDGNILERLEEYMNSHPETVEGLRQIIIDFEDIIDDINNLEAPDQMIDAVDLGIHLARLAPDTTKGSAFKDL